MKALYYDGERLRYVQRYPDPLPEPGEALVRVRMAGICNTDLEVLRGYADFTGILGHEFVGVVEACEDAAWVGQRVVGEINLACGECALCQRGLPHHCLQRKVLGIRGHDGAFAERLALPLRNLHRVPATVPDERAVFVEPLAAALEVLEQVHVRPQDRVVVLGDGKLGLLVVQVLRLTGCDLGLVGHHPEHLALAAQWGVRTWLEEEALPTLADVAVECTGNPRGFARARALLRPRGTLVLKSTYAGRVEVDLASLVVDEVTLVGSRCGPFGAALRLLERNLVEVDRLVSHLFPLEEGIRALEVAQRPGVLKVLIVVQ
ncbi:MAG: MDR/zinc-dependent alcohol dehydrogenase-like family protein [Anaerolineae bacterium]